MWQHRSLRLLSWSGSQEGLSFWQGSAGLAALRFAEPALLSQCWQGSCGGVVWDAGQMVSLPRGAVQLGQDVVRCR